MRGIITPVRSLMMGRSSVGVQFYSQLGVASNANSENSPVNVIMNSEFPIESVFTSTARSTAPSCAVQESQSFAGAPGFLIL